jgi:hypothetical protein
MRQILIARGIITQGTLDQLLGPDAESIKYDIASLTANAWKEATIED